MLKIITLVLGAAVLAVLATGCGAAKSSTGNSTPPASMPAISPTSLANTSWVLVSYGDPANLTQVIAGTKITLIFNAASDQVSGNGGVNGYGGSVQRIDNHIYITQIIHTEMASLNQAVNNQENAYFLLLGNSQSMEFKTGSLTIHCQGGQELVFSAA